MHVVLDSVEVAWRNVIRERWFVGSSVYRGHLAQEQDVAAIKVKFEVDERQRNSAHDRQASQRVMARLGDCLLACVFEGDGSQSSDEWWIYARVRSVGDASTRERRRQGQQRAADVTNRPDCRALQSLYCLLVW